MDKGEVGVSTTGLAFNIGNELDLQIVVNGQALDDLGLVESTERKVQSHLLEKTPTNNDGYTVSRVTYTGWEYDFSLTRQNDAFDDLVVALVNNYHAHGPEPSISATETVINAGSVSQWQLSGGTLIPESIGTFKGADAVDGITFKIKFTKKQKVVGNNTAPASINSSTLL